MRGGVEKARELTRTDRKITKNILRVLEWLKTDNDKEKESKDKKRIYIHKEKKNKKIKKRNNSFSTESIEDKKKYFFIFDVVPRCIPKEKRETKNTLRRKKD